MARETKVGLLAGLAFIICFAVILANRGQTRRYAADTVRDPAIEQPWARRTGAPARSVGTATPGGDHPTRNDPAAPRTPAHPDGGTRQAGHTNQPSVRHPTVSGSEVDWTTDVETAGHTLAHLPDRVDVGNPTVTPGPVPTNPLSDTTLTAFHGDPHRANANLEELLKRRAQTGGSQPRSESPTTTMASLTHSAVPSVSSRDSGVQRPETKTANPTVGIRSHRVGPGDTLSSIARRTYGSGERRFLEAILEANRTALTNPDHLKVGMTLILPDAQPQPPTLAAASPSTAPRQARSVTDESAAPTGTRWYQVQKNDRYVSIAREQLGDASRWHELHELNKDKFPNADQIREGVRIKLPTR